MIELQSSPAGRHPWVSGGLPSSPTQAAGTSSTSTLTGPEAATGSGAAYDKAIDELRSARVAVPESLPRADSPAARLDQLRQAASGPYDVNGQTVDSPAQFRMNGGYNQSVVDSGGKLHDELVAAAKHAGVSLASLGLIQVGRGDPRALVRVTQALIDEGHLAFDADSPLSTQIRDLQWRYGIGIDCAGYVYRATAAIHGPPSQLGLKPTVNENLTGLPFNPRFARVAVANARPGDVMVLTGTGGRRDPGHNLVVYSHASAPPAQAVLDRCPAAAAFIAEHPNVEMLEVDSSFGAGPDGKAGGGVRRDVLLYDAASSAWCTCKCTSSPSVTVGPVPYDEKALAGLFRPKEAA